MPFTKTPVIGNFCWVEANVEDTARSKAFYAELFGWKPSDMPMPDGGDYTMMRLGEHRAAGLMKLPEKAKQLGARSHWLAYVAVSDVKAATAKAEKLGAMVCFGPEVVGPGTLVVLADPTGAVLALWESTNMGSFVWGERNTLCWVELTTTDVEAATRFYVELFGWKTEKHPMGDFEYTVLSNGDQQIGGLMPQPKPMAEAKAPSFWTVYFDVEDCDAAMLRAKKLGGELATPAMDIPGVGRFAIVKDPNGAPFAVIENAPSKS